MQTFRFDGVHSSRTVRPVPPSQHAARALPVTLFSILSRRTAGSKVADGARDDARPNQEDVHERETAHEDQGSERYAGQSAAVCLPDDNRARFSPGSLMEDMHNITRTLPNLVGHHTGGAISLGLFHVGKKI